MEKLHFLFEWDETKAVSNVHKHGVTFDLARTVFNDPRLLTIGDLGHSEQEERWFSIGLASNGAVLSLAYLWTTSNNTVVKIRLISARKATQREMLQYRESI